MSEAKHEKGMFPQAKHEKGIIEMLEKSKYDAAKLNYASVLGRLQECIGACKQVIQSGIKEPAEEIITVICETQDKVFELLNPKPVLKVEEKPQAE